MKELFYQEDGETPLFETGLDLKNKSDAKEVQRRLSNWRHSFVETFCNTPHGRQVLWLLIHETYVFRKFGQHNASAYALEGKRELGQDLIDFIGAEQVLKTLIAVKAEAHKEE